MPTADPLGPADGVRSSDRGRTRTSGRDADGTTARTSGWDTGHGTGTGDLFRPTVFSSHGRDRQGS